MLIERGRKMPCSFTGEAVVKKGGKEAQLFSPEYPVIHGKSTLKYINNILSTRNALAYAISL